MYDGLEVSLKMGSLYQPVFWVNKWDEKPTVTVDGVTDLRGVTSISGDVIIKSQGYDGVQITTNRKSWQEPFVNKILSNIRLVPYSLSGSYD